MSLTKQMNDAVLTDLNGITSPAGVKAARRSLTINTPGARDLMIGLQWGGGGAGQQEGETLTAGGKTGASIHRIRLRALRKTKDPEGDMDDFVDSIRNAVEKPTSTIMVIDEVLSVDVEETEPFHTSDDLKLGWAGVEMIVVARYDYERGAL